MNWTRLAHRLSWLTAVLIAMTMTAGTVAVWLATHGPAPEWAIEPIHPAAELAVYVLLMVAPWWALLAVFFARLRWLEPRASRQREERSADRSSDSSRR